jgi:hypothetical protein
VSVLKEQDYAVSDKLERIMEDILAVMKKLDLSIDYLASSVTGQDPFEIGLSQSALGRMVGKARGGQLKENKKMKITKLQLRNIIQEVLDEVEFHGETPAGQLYGTEEEDARFSMQLAAEKVMKRAGLDQEEMSYTLKAMEGDTVEAGEFWDSSAHQKLYDFLDIPYEVDSQSMGAEMTPDQWILDYLRQQPGPELTPLPPGRVAKNPPQYGGWDPFNTGRSSRRPPGPGRSRFRRESVTSESEIAPVGAKGTPEDRYGAAGAMALEWWKTLPRPRQDAVIKGDGMPIANLVKAWNDTGRPAPGEDDGVDAAELQRAKERGGAARQRAGGRAQPRGVGIRGVTSEEKKKITKKELQKIVQEEFNAFFSETERTIK